MDELVPVHILHVEDDDIEARALRRAFRRARLANPITHVSDGIEALACLRGTDGAAKLGWPLVILLDLRMPRMDGLEFLRELRNDPELHGLTVFVLTTSDDERDVTSAYAQHIAGYITKDRVGERFQRLISMFSPFWQIVAFPASPPTAR